MNELRRLLQRSCVCGLLVAFVVLPKSATAADAGGEPLHCRIDRLIESARIGPPATRAGDAEFLRRISLDLTGMPPSVDELRAFVADKTADKRPRKIDRLLASPLFARHWATTLDVMLMERRPSVNVSADLWQSYLLAAAQSNRPLNQVMGELLSANSADPKLRPAARFMLDRGSEPNLITRDVGRIFFGRDMQCAQCHNHPIVKDYQQSDYYGLLAFMTPGYALTRKEGNKDVTFHAEKAGADLLFDSVFVRNDKHVTGPRVPGGTEVPEPAYSPGEEYEVKPADGTIAVPRFSRRLKLASLATSGANRAFNENVANRLWAVMMGRGLVHPVDLHHPSNPPSHPELLKLLAVEIVARKFNVRDFLRELALTEVYQQVIDLPPETEALPAQFGARLAEQKARTEPLEAAAEAARKQYLSAVKAWYQAEESLVPLLAEQGKATAKHAECEKKREAAQKAVMDAQSQCAARRDTAKALTEAASRAQEVVKRLPKDKELIDAATTFTKRNAAAAAELTAFEKAIAEKNTVLKKAGDEVAAAAQPVLAARAKVSPVRESVRQKEKIALEVRQRMAETRLVAEDHQKRVTLLEAFARYKTLQLQIAASDQAAVALGKALAQSRKRSAELTIDLQQKQDNAKIADLARVAAEKTRADARASLALHQKIVGSIDAALSATESARQLLPDDPALSQAAQLIKDKSGMLQKIGPALLARIDAATSWLGKAAQRHNSSRAAVQGCLDEKSRRDNAVTAAQAAVAAHEARAKAARSEVAVAASELSTLRGSQFGQAQLKPLTPEQMCFSILKVTGVYDRYLKAEEAELNKKQPLIGPITHDPISMIARSIELERRTYEKLKGNVPPFVRIYAAAPGQPQNDFFATADQALFAANGGSLNSWIAPAGGNVSEHLIQEKEPAKAAQELYMTILSRPPDPDESAEVVRLLTARANERAAVVQELVWGLLNSVEFRFNH
jgi:Protein of unknown function (DUF1549)/Protein of unknown function (DUF1553)